MRIYYPKRVKPNDPQNQELERFVSEVVSHVVQEDLEMRFFGAPDVEAIPARITGRRTDSYEPPRDLVIVAFNQENPAGYVDISEDPSHNEAPEIAMLVRSDMQRQGIGESMLKIVVEEARKKGIGHLKGYLHPENYKMNRALKKWSEDLHLRVRTDWEAGELIYIIDV